MDAIRRAGAVSLAFVFLAQAQGSLAHIAAGGGWQTTIMVLNLSKLASIAQVILFSDSGTPLTVPAAGQTPASQYQLALPANGSATLVLNGSAILVTGWARLDSVNGAVIRGQ